MSDDKIKDDILNNPLEELEGPDGANKNAASRARNRTVLLTPELTGQVRAALNKGGEDSSGPDLIPDNDSWGESASGSRMSEPTQKRPTSKFRATGLEEPVAPVESPAHSSPAASSGASGIVSSSPESKVIGFLISFDKNENGDVYEIRVGRWLLTSRPTDHGDYILINDETISPLHAILRATSDGKLQVLDQLSEFGTGIIVSGETEEEDIAGTMSMLGHGDKVRFGKRDFMVCLIPGVGE